MIVIIYSAQALANAGIKVAKDPVCLFTHHNRRNAHTYISKLNGDACVPLGIRTCFTNVFAFL